MNIAQISDLHLTENAKQSKYPVNTLNCLKQVLVDISQYADTLDLLLITGDIADDGHPESYQNLRDSLMNFPLPYYLIPGNHDNREVMAQFFPELESSLQDTGGFIQYVVEKSPLRLIALDTLIPGRGKGILCEKRLAWLENQLQQSPDTPTVLFMHHPPFKSGLVNMDKYAYLADAEHFRDLLRPHQQIKLILCGHLHRSVQTQVAGIPVRAVPSAAFAHRLQLAESQTKGLLLEAPKYEIHCFQGGEFVSHSVSLEAV